MTERLAKALVWLDLLYVHGTMSRLTELHPDYVEAYRLAIIAAQQEIATIRKCEEVDALAEKR